MGTIIRGEVKKANSVREEVFFEYEASRVAEERILEEEFSADGFFVYTVFAIGNCYKINYLPRREKGVIDEYRV